MHKGISCCILLFVCSLVHTQGLQKFTEAEIREDFRFLKESFDTYNPALGVFHSRSEFEAIYDSLYQALDVPMTDLEFYPYIIRLAEATREGHTLVGRASDTTYNIYKGFFDGSFRFMPIACRGAVVLQN